jgi:hypothetical protein
MNLVGKKMDYQTFEQYSKTEIPMNRKEKFFSATVLPSILFHNGLSNFYTFLHLIDKFPAQITEKNTSDHFFFFSEYSLRQSAGPRNVGVQIDTESGDIPDILIEIIRPVRSVVVIEAKMFQNYPQKDFDDQMNRQKRLVLNGIQEKFKIDDDKVFHMGLVPEKLGYKNRQSYQVINWEVFLGDSFATKGNCFINYLRFALTHYYSLVEKKQSKIASTVKELISGMALFRDAEEGKFFWVGRKGGIKQFTEDAKDGSWVNRRYSWNDNRPDRGQAGNWITGAKFAQIIRAHKS